MYKEYNEGNIFYQIVNGKVTCNKVYEDDKVLAFHDINPVAPTHILVIPKDKYISFHDFIAKSDYVEHFFLTVRKIAIQSNLDTSGYRLVTNHGQDSGQIVPHFHVHIIGGKKLGEIA